MIDSESVALAVAAIERTSPRRPARLVLTTVSTSIGELREGPLHAVLKQALTATGDRTEVRVERWVIDLVRADGELVEIQTGGFGPLGPKLDGLLDQHRVRIVHPIAARRRIVRVDEHGEVLSAKRSPRRGSAFDLFERLVSLPTMLAHPNLTLELVLCEEDHVRAPAPRRSRSGRRTVDPGERRLTAVLERIVLERPAQLVALLPADALSGTFTTRELSTRVGCTRNLAQRIVYCLRALELIERVEAVGREPVYRCC